MQSQLDSLKIEYIEARRQLNEHSVRIIKIKELEKQLQEERTKLQERIKAQENQKTSMKLDLEVYEQQISNLEEIIEKHKALDGKHKERLMD